MSTRKNILKSCKFETAVRVRKCSGNKNHIISPNERCLVFKENMRKKNYCLNCARSIIERGVLDLNKMISEI